MKLAFDLDQIVTTEFGIGRDDGDGHAFCVVTVDDAVQTALQEITQATRDNMRQLTNSPSLYEPSEKYASTEYVYLPLEDDLAERLHDLHFADNLDRDATALADPTTLFCYFARMTDKQGRRLTALRRATQFKGIVKSRLLRVRTEALKLIQDRVFKLDNDFDVLIDHRNVHILRPSGFEFAGNLQQAVLAAVPKNIKDIQRDLGFIDFTNIQEYASSRPRAARYLSSIRVRQELTNVDKRALKDLCENTGVAIRVTNGKIVIQDACIMGFLEVLDRRRYGVELVKGAPEYFKAASRSRIHTATD